MKRNKIGVIGVGNMAKAIIKGITDFDVDISKIYLFDLIRAQCDSVETDKKVILSSVEDVIENSDCVLISVKPQNYPDILSLIKNCDGYSDKLYISIGAGISTDSVREALGDVSVIRVLPNVPMLIGRGVSVICYSNSSTHEDFEFVKTVFKASGSIIEIDERDMNEIIGVTSSSPAYVFKFIDSVYQGAIAQGLDSKELLDAICDVVIGSAMMLKSGKELPQELISKVASKGGTTERALAKLEEYNFSEGICEAMKACTERAYELGGKK